MKTLKFFPIVLFVLIFASCSRNADSMFLREEEAAAPSTAALSVNLNNILCHQGDPEVALCSPKIVPMCTPEASIGTVQVATGADGRTYVTYETTGAWRLKEVNLYTGDGTVIPTTVSGNPVPELFPYTKSFSSNLPKKYTWGIPDLPSNFIVAANAVVVRTGNNGSIQQIENVWGDGCNGNMRVAINK